jgi:hypothetical protein
MDVALVIVTAVQATAAVFALVYAYRLAKAALEQIGVMRDQSRAALDQVGAMRDQTRAALDQLGVMRAQLTEALEAREDAQIPLMIPVKFPTINEIQGYRVDADSIVVKLKNAGPGLAFNVRACLFPPGANPKRLKDVDTRYHSVIWNMPWAPQVEDNATFNDSGLDLSGADQIGGNTLAPLHPLVVKSPGLPHAMTRLTITYTDVFGQKRASAFDWRVGGAWMPVGQVKNKVNEDLLDLSDEHVRQRPRAELMAQRPPDED